MKKVIPVILFLSLNLLGLSETITVINNNNEGVGSLRQAIIDSDNGDSIIFSPILIAGGSDTILLTGGEIVFAKDLTITGLINTEDTLFISGNDSSRIFKFTGGTITLDKVAIINGNVTTFPEVGGGIYSSASSLTISNSIIRGNSVYSASSDSKGGGIYTENHLILTNTIIDHNIASADGDADGGGIYTVNKLTLTNSTINNNTVSSGSNAHGGGIYTVNKLTLTNSTINNNNTVSTGSNAYGGGIYTVNKLAITNSTIKNNTVSADFDGYGGGIYSIDSLTIANSVISSNTSSGAYAFGGGVSCIAMKIINTYISDNRTTASFSFSYGGGIYSNPYPFASLIIDGSTITGNTASSVSLCRGGGIHSGNFVKITNSTISENTATFYDSESETDANGGGMYLFGIDSSTIDNSIIIDNTAMGSTESLGSGGGIDASTSLKITNSLIGMNTASSLSLSGYGGGILTNGASLMVQNTTIKNNSADTEGGGIGYLTQNSIPKSLEIERSTINGNTSGLKGGGIYISAHHNSGSPLLSISHSTLHGNACNSDLSEGGAICITWFGEVTPNLIISNSTITGNTASTGGSVYLFNKPLTIEGNIFSENTGSPNIVGTITPNNGYNIFQDTPTGFVGTDQVNVESTSLNLGPLQDNGGNTFTRVPGFGSVAINSGNPLDLTDAQNGPVIGVRDIGAAENQTDIVTLIAEIGHPNFKIYPNPSSNLINIKSITAYLSSSIISLQNLQGKNLDVPIEHFENKITLDVSSLAKGSYIVTISNPNQNENYLILKE